MRKKPIIFTVIILVLAFCVSIMAKYSIDGQKNKKQHVNDKAKTNIKVVVPATASNSSTKGNSNSKSSLSRGGSMNISTDKKTLHKVEAVDWWKKGQYVFSNGTIAEVTDVYTKKKFKVKRTMGTNHADVEALTKEDTEIIKNIWGGFSWERRPIILTINNNRYAASMSAMPHAGLDSEPAYDVVNNRSGGYGSGQNLDVIKGNGMDGHMDIHFLNSTRHKDGKKDPQHQLEISRALKN